MKYTLFILIGILSQSLALVIRFGQPGHKKELQGKAALEQSLKCLGNVGRSDETESLLILPGRFAQKVTTLYEEDNSYSKNIQNMFLFNSSVSEEFEIQNMPPFKLPEYLVLTDYFVVLPRTVVEEEFPSFFQDSALLRNKIESLISKLPIFQSKLNEGKPLLVFMFEETTSILRKSSNPIMNVNNYLYTPESVGGVSTFFDSFAASWIDNARYNNIVGSLFCVFGGKSKCTRVKESLILVIYPEVLTSKADYIVPLSSVKMPEKSPRHPQYRQIIFPELKSGNIHKRFSIFSDDEDCQEITWFNIFRHSIFGRPMFCRRNPR